MDCSEPAAILSPKPFRSWFARLFCIGQQNIKPRVNAVKSNSTIKHRQSIQMSLLGSYKTSTLCKMTRKNFLMDARELEGARIPSVVAKYLGCKTQASTAVVRGDISPKMTKSISYVLRMVNSDTKQSGDCVVGDFLSVKLSLNELCIFRPTIPTVSRLALLQQDEVVGKEIYQVVNRFNNSIIILPRDTVLDEIGVLLSNLDKSVEVKSIVINGNLEFYVVYVGHKDFVRVAEQDEMEFVVKELEKDLRNQNSSIAPLVRKVSQKSSINQVLFLLKKSINQAYVDTALSCFIRNSIFRDYLTTEEAVQLFPSQQLQRQYQPTPSLRQTAKFNFTFSTDKINNPKQSIAWDLLNGQSGVLLYQNQVETFAETQISMMKLDIRPEYNPL